MEKKFYNLGARHKRCHHDQDQSVSLLKTKNRKYLVHVYLSYYFNTITARDSIVFFVFTKLMVLEYYFKNNTRASTRLDSDQVRPYVGPDLGPNCLQNHQQTLHADSVKVKDRTYLFFSNYLNHITRAQEI